MKTSTIPEAKHNLSNLIHRLETEEAIHLTHHGNPVAVMMSEDQDQNLIAPKKSLNTAILEIGEIK
ncbi:MAG: type II toxin-antitoxin system Phd/YefM family antitoxin [Methylobacter sp.]|nr:type II toxin-antitoxin system Phd/YefM family antitoxin [Methylobacter sp.]